MTVRTSVHLLHNPSRWLKQWTHRQRWKILNSLGARLSALWSDENHDLLDVGTWVQQLLKQHLSHEARRAGDEDRLVFVELLNFRQLRHDLQDKDGRECVYAANIVTLDLATLRLRWWAQFVRQQFGFCSNLCLNVLGDDSWRSVGIYQRKTLEWLWFNLQITNFWWTICFTAHPELEKKDYWLKNFCDFMDFRKLGRN